MWIHIQIKVTPRTNEFKDKLNGVSFTQVEVR